MAPGGVAVFNLVPFSPRYLERCGKIFSAFGNCHSFQDWEGLNNVVIAARGAVHAQAFQVPKYWSSADELSADELSADELSATLGRMVMSDGGR